jgi:ABC-type multidrug transport system ATPase subunit
MNAIRQQLGVCPQHDVLWDDLTSREHFSLFGALKGMTENDIHQATHTLLSDVSLLKAADRPVRTFSGGMKRRLSVALSFLGSPKIVFLDEPSSGMDPYIRRDLWNLILRMRQNRVILMTTHSMEEADILASKIAVMVDGKVRAVGSPIELKNRFAGYNIKLSVAVESSARLSQMIQSELRMFCLNCRRRTFLFKLT